MIPDGLYAGREQSQVKHLILKRYLQRFAQIIGQKWNSITYVDCFAGPWQTQSEDLADSSFAIAVKELRAARESLSQNLGRKIQIRGFFLEENSDAHRRLNEFASEQSDMELCTRNLRLEDAIDQIIQFVRAGKDTFPFILIDPKGWSGFDVDVIKPLLALNPGEVLINFMIEHIRRFVECETPNIRNSFVRLFGTDAFRTKIAGLPAELRDDMISRTYMESVKAAGRFDYGSLAVVLYPDIDRRYFYLPYLTRNPKGIEVFKDAEKHSMSDMERLRATASQRNRIHKSKQQELFGAEECHDPTYFEGLRIQYLTKSRDAVLERLESKKCLSYDEAWVLALTWPMVWDSDVKLWIAEWLSDGTLREIAGMKKGQRVPKRNESNILHFGR